MGKYINAISTLITVLKNDIPALHGLAISAEKALIVGFHH
jgi:hypothetical protein